MKNLLNILLISALATSCATSKKLKDESIPLADTSKTSLDWQGVYSAIIPTEKEGSIQLTIHLLDESNYILSRTLQKDGSETFHEQGKFTWNKAGSEITLTPDNKGVAKSFAVVENGLVPLDANGNMKSDLYFIFKNDTEIFNKYWKITELAGEKIVWQNENQREPHIIFRSEENRFNGNTGCNGFSGTYDLHSGNVIMLGQAMSTKMYCEGAMTVENQIFQILEKVRSFHVDGDAMSFQDENGDIIAKFEAVYF